jgi:hypothetical protein
MIGATQQAAANAVAGTEEAFRSILTLLSQVSSTAPFHSSVSNHEEMAKRQEAGRLDKGGEHIWIPFSGSVREHAPPRFESGGTVDIDTLEQWFH